MRRPRQAVEQGAVRAAYEYREEDFAEKAKAYARGMPELNEDEMQILSFASIDQLIPFLQKLSGEKIERFMEEKYAKDFSGVANEDFHKELERIGLDGLEKIILREANRGIVFNNFIGQLKNIDIPALQEKLKNAMKNRKVDPRIMTQLEVQKFADSDGSDAGKVTRFMNEWPGLIEDEVFQPWLDNFNKLTNKCVLFDEDGAVYTADSEKEAQSIDATSQKGIRKLVEQCAQQALNDFCDGSGRIKASMREALQLDKLDEHVRNNKISEDFILEKLISNYLVNQVGSFLAEKAGGDIMQQLVSEDEQISKQARHKIKKYGMLQQHFMTVLTDGFGADYTELLTPRVVIQTSLARLNFALNKRKAQCGEDDAVYIAGVETYNNANDIGKQILSAPRVNNAELNSFKAIVRGTAEVVRDPIHGPSDKLYEDIKKAPTKKSSGWAKLGAGVLFVLGVVAISCGLAGTAMTGGIDLGVSTYLGCKIAGACFAAAGALWAGYQYKQSGALAGSISKVVGAAKKVVSEEDPAAVVPLQSPRGLN